jgi:hypothetical protein
MKYGRKRRLDVKKILSKNGGRSSTDKLFDKVKEIEARNREQANTENLSLDERMMRAAETKHETTFKVIKTTPAPKAGQNVVRGISSMSEKAQTKKSELAQYRFSPDQENPDYYIVNNPKMSPILNYRRILKEFLEMMNSVEDQFSYCCSKVSEADREVQDFLHELRMPKRNAYEGFKLYQLGHHLEVKRQAFKNAQEDLRPLSTLASMMKEQLERIENCAKHLDTLKLSRENKVYIPRSDLNLPVGDRYRSLSPEEQQEIRQNYERRRKAS